jgi:hypothetical protein
MGRKIIFRRIVSTRTGLRALINCLIVLIGRLSLDLDALVELPPTWALWLLFSKDQDVYLRY